MSAAIRFDQPIPSVMDSIPSGYRPGNAEAPDCGDPTSEAPEIHRGESSEAPEAAEGRMGYTENQFTHGRSQS
ncbi:hypothetical protein P12x_000386 [Tundrisphaera lichenicola]|uniref:hypothetical protein n=1 Tax=Tundrisphaera lichenicola TaxID=2029860 RepID=UPI003EB9F9E8